jgi:hypothetical protein
MGLSLSTPEEEQQQVDETIQYQSDVDDRLAQVDSRLADLQAKTNRPPPQQVPNDVLTKSNFQSAAAKDLRFSERTMWCADGKACRFPAGAQVIRARGDIKHRGTLSFGNRVLLSDVPPASKDSKDYMLRFSAVPAKGDDPKKPPTATVMVDKLQLGDKWMLSGVGDATANDDWLRLFRKDGKGYHGGVAAGKAWLGTGGLEVTAGHTTLKGGVSALNPQKAGTHFPWTKDGRNYIRGDTTLTGHLDMAGDLNVDGKLHIGRNKNADDPYHIEKVSTGADKSTLRVTINDNVDEAVEIWGNACAVGDCKGPGALQHRFSADGQAYHTKGIQIKPGDAGHLVETNYGSSQDRYGIGQFRNGALRVYAASAFAPATVNLSMARANGGFRDVVTVGNDGVMKVNGTIKTNNDGIPGKQSYPQGWGGGVHALDVWANGSITAGRNGQVASYMNNAGTVGCKQLCVGGSCLSAAEVAKLKKMVSGG